MKKNITKKIKYIGVFDKDIDLFEGQFVVKEGISYNSYLILDENITIMDTVDVRKADIWLNRLLEELVDKKPTYLVVQHMEPDHCGSLLVLLNKFPDIVVVGNDKTHKYISQFFPNLNYQSKIVKNGDSLSLGFHTLNFIFAPMVHWPEVMFSYETSEKLLFSADAWGKFGNNENVINWEDEARRYYFGIVGKYGLQVQNVLKKAKTLEISQILPLHGPILENNLSYYLDLYNTWSLYKAEKEGLLIVYTSIYGHTKKAVDFLVDNLDKRIDYKVIDLARSDIHEVVSQAFKYESMIIATTTYNTELFPIFSYFLHLLKERNYQNRNIGIIENGTWSPNIINRVQEEFTNSKNISYYKNNVTIISALNETSQNTLLLLATELNKTYAPLQTSKNNIDAATLFSLSYGLYVITSQINGVDNGLIVNTVTQVTDSPKRVAVTISKANYSEEIIRNTGLLNVNILTTKAPFDIFKQFGFQSGRQVNKFKDQKEIRRTPNGLIVLNEAINGVLSLKVISSSDLGTHTMFICDVSEAYKINDEPSVTYTYYQQNIKPKPESKNKGWVCTVCGFIYEGENLPDDYICPLCKHGKEVFEKIV
ncbi:MAG: flavin reductase [Bacillales bacterium]|jgi:flavorubredoxin/flavin reductase (DIM6/NTAB) family NADH-FMN oxidoreductase RutF|nr:flavin reductase [Bacillales bacterium]